MSKTIVQKACSIAYEHWREGIDDENLALKSVHIWRKNEKRFRAIYRMHIDSLNAWNTTFKKLKELANQSF